MKILFVLPDLVIGGVTTVVLNIIDSMHKKNIDVKLVTLFNKNDVNVENIDHETLDIKSISNIPNAILKMRKVINTFKPDIVHSHTLYSHLLVYCCSYFKKNFKLISSEHGTYNFVLKFYKRMFLFKLLSNISDIVTNVSNISCDSYLSQNIIPRAKIRTIYNGIDISKFTYSSESRIIIRTRLGIYNNQKVIGYIGRISKEKNLPNLINAVALLDLDYKLIIVGKGPESENIKKMVINKKIYHKVIFLGELNETNEYYSAFDVLVLSSDTEGLPTVVLEAIASKCPVVTTDCGGVKEIFPEDYSYIVPKNDSVRLSKKINEILSLEKDYREKITAKNYTKLISNFTLDLSTQNWINLYEDIILDSK